MQGREDEEDFGAEDHGFSFGHTELVVMDY